MQDRDDFDEPNDYDRESEGLIANMEQNKKKFTIRNLNETRFVYTEKYNELKLKLRDSFVNSLYEKLNKYLKDEVNSKYYDLFSFDHNNKLIYQDCDDVKILTKKDKQLKSIKTIIRDLGVRRLAKL